MKEMHKGELSAHTWRDKIQALLEDKYYWQKFKKKSLSMWKDVQFVNVQKMVLKTQNYTYLF